MITQTGRKNNKLPASFGRKFWGGGREDVYDWLREALEREFEVVRPLKEGPRGTIRLLRHRETGRRFVLRQYAGSDKAGMIFAILFGLAGMTLSFGGLGTPLMIGVFFLLASVNLCHRFYARGMKNAGFVSALPLILSGLSAACAVCVHGAFVIPVIGVALLFAAGMVRQYRARRYYLDKAIAAAETEESASAQAEEKETPSPAKRMVAEVVSEYRYKNAAAIASFAASFVIGALVIALLAILPSYFAYVKL